MRLMGRPRRRAAAGLQGLHQGVNLRLAEHPLLEAVDIANKPRALGDVGTAIRAGCGMG